MIQSTASQAQLKLCSHCGEHKPIDQFRRRRKGSEKRHPQCRECFNEYTRQYRAKKRRKRIDKFASEITHAKGDMWKIGVLCAALMKQFGGPEQFAIEWKEAIDWAKAEGRVHLVLRHMTAILGLVAANDEAEEMKLKHMTDEELRAELARLLRDVSGGQ